uniref:Gem-associated protein 5-like n=1 Tax=Saccoglossus kowalevskii TaxID=10224 RepID=A0ABM0MIB0_SACKO|nr:PREDICTED: gem-associated protein 5-like [Saccoglossus kowalevskii]
MSIIVTSQRLQPSTGQVLINIFIYTFDETGVIIQWNYVSGDTKQFFPENGHIFSLACSPHNVQFLAVGYKLGNILIIDIKNRGCVIHKLRGHDDEVHSLSWAPTLGEDIRQKKGKKKEAGNGEGAVDDQSEEELGNEIPSSTDGCLLASGSRDRTIRLWSTSKGKAVLTLKLPSKASGFKGKMEDTGKSRVWLTLYWPKNKPRELLSSSHGGDLLMWDLCKPGKQKWKLLGQSDGKGHNRIVFNIVPGGDAALNTIVTVSMDRQIILWNLKSCRAVSTIPTLGGFVYTIVASPIDPGRLAVGVGDNMIRIWNTSSPSNTYDVTVIWQGIRSKVTALSWHPFREGHLAYGTDDGRVGIHDVFSQKPASVSNSYHKRTVYCVDWGPPCPPIDNKSSPSHCVYSCGGEGIILQHNPYRLADDAIDINSVIRKTNNIKHKVPQRSEVSWKPDGTVCAVGNDDGSVEVFQAPHLLLLCTIQIHHKIINRIEWYPDFTHSKRSSKHSSVPDIDSGDNEDCRNWLAVGGNDPPIHVYDLTAILCAGVPLHTPVTGSYITLNGHSQRVTGLSWSPHGDKKLASVSYDGTAQVWDVMNGEPIANYRAHHGRLFSVIWSVLHPDVVYTGGEDFTLQKWRISQQEFIKPPKNKRAAQSSQRTGKSRGRGKNRQNRDVKSRIPPLQDTLVPVECVEMMHGVVPQISPEEALNYYGIVTDNQYAPSVGQILPSEKKIISSQLFEVSMANVAASESSAADVMETAFTGAKRADKRRKKQKSLFPNCSSLDNRGKHYVQEDCRYLAKTIYSAGSDLSIGQGEHTNLGMFSDRKAAFRMFKQEGDYHLEQGNIDNFIQLEIWKGNIGRALQVAKDKGQLNDWLVSMAPLGGQNLWIQSCECYAKQLCSQEQYMKAVSYYLSAHKVYDAINVLKEHKLYKEAVALSKVRLSPKDPVLLELYWEWAAHLESDGNYEQAAKCYLATDNRCDAIRSLARRGDITSLKIASQVAVYANELDQASSLALQCANQCQESGDWLQAHEMLLTLPNLKGHHLQLILHEMLVKSLLQMNFISSEAYQDVLFTDHPITMQDRMQRWCNALSPGVKEYLQPKACGDDFSRWPICTFDNGDLFYCRAIRIWLHYHNIEYDELSDVYEALSQSKPTRKEHLSQKEILLHLSHEMTLALLSLVTSQTPVNHWFQAIILCHERGYYDMEQNIFTIMLPQGWKTFSLLRMLMKEGTYYKDENVHSQQLNKLDSLEAYYCLLVVYSLWWSREDNKKSQQLAMSGMIGGGDSYKANGDSAQHVADGECKDLAEGGVTDITKYGFSSDRDAEQEKDTDISESRSDAEVALQGLNG